MLVRQHISSFSPSVSISAPDQATGDGCQKRYSRLDAGFQSEPALLEWFAVGDATQFLTLSGIPKNKLRNPLIIIQSILSVVLSLAAAVFLFMVIEYISSILHPWPEDFSRTFEEIAHQVETYPAWVLALLGGVGYGATMLICTFIATYVGHNRNPWYGYGMGALLFAMVVFNLTKLPYPTWFWVLMFATLPPAAYFGTKCGATTIS